jgi:hypothetical protein
MEEFGGICRFRYFDSRSHEHLFLELGECIGYPIVETPLFGLSFVNASKLSSE